MSFPITTGDLVTAADLNNLRGLLGSADGDGTSTTLEVTGIAAAHFDLVIEYHGHHAGSGLEGLSLTLNSNTTSGNYRYALYRLSDNGTETTSTSQSAANMLLGSQGDDGSLSGATIRVSSYAAARNHVVKWSTYASAGSSADDSRYTTGGGVWLGGAAVTSVQLISATSNFAASADLRVYGIGVQ